MLTLWRGRIVSGYSGAYNKAIQEAEGAPEVEAKGSPGTVLTSSVAKKRLLKSHRQRNKIWRQQANLARKAVEDRWRARAKWEGAKKSEKKFEPNKRLIRFLQQDVVRLVTFFTPANIVWDILVHTKLASITV